MIKCNNTTAANKVTMECLQYCSICSEFIDILYPFNDGCRWVPLYTMLWLAIFLKLDLKVGL